MGAWEQRMTLRFDQILERVKQGMERRFQEHEENSGVFLERRFEETSRVISETKRRVESICDEMVVCLVEEDSGFLEDDVEQSAYQAELEEDIAGLDKDGVAVKEGMKQITYQAEIKEEYAGLTNNDVFLWVTGELVSTEKGHGDFTGEKKTRLGSLTCGAHGGMLREKMVGKNLMAFGKLVVNSFLQGFERSIGGIITDISEDVSTKRRRFGAGTGTIT